MTNYSQPTSKEIPEEAYLCQKIEVDAISFAHYLMNKLYKIKSIIPEIIANEVAKRLCYFSEE